MTVPGVRVPRGGRRQTAAMFTGALLPLLVAGAVAGAGCGGGPAAATTNSSTGQTTATPVYSASVSNSSLTFGPTEVGSTAAAQQIVVTNTGNQTVSGGSLVIGGTGAAAFAETDNCGTSLAAGATCTINITFTPSALGAFTASISLTNTSLPSPPSVALAGTGAGAVAGTSVGSVTISANVGASAAPSPITLSNTGNAALNISAISIGGAAAADYGQSNNCGASVAAGGSCTITVSFTPSAMGARAATLSVSDDSLGGGTQSVSLSGTGYAAVAALSGGPLSFSAAPTSTATAQTLTLSNSGNAALSVSGIALGGANASDFAQTNNCGSSVAAGGSCTISVSFTPAGVGTLAANLTVSDNALGSASQSATLNGTGVGALASLAAGPLNFTTSAGTNSATQTVTLSNGGTTALAIASVALSGANFSAFNLPSDNCGTSVAAGGSCTISVNFEPTTIGTMAATLTVNDNAYGSPSQTISLAGTSTGAEASLSGGPLTFTVAAGSSASPQPLTLSNAGNAALAVSSIALTGPNAGDFGETNTCGSSVPAGGSCTISVTYAPAAVGASSASVVVNDSAYQNASQNATLTGTGEGALATLTGGPLNFTAFQGVTTAAQPLTLSNGGNQPLAISSIALNGTDPGDFGQTNNCGSSLAAGDSCAISVTFLPPTTGDYSAGVTVSDNAYENATQSAQLGGIGDTTPLVLSGPLLAPATQGAAYDDGDSLEVPDVGATGGAVVAIAGGTAPYTCSLMTGTLPAGMTMAAVTPTVGASSLCVVSGTPTTDGDFPLTVQVQDSLGQTGNQAATLVVLSASLPVVSSTTATSVSPTQEQITWTTDVAASSKVCYSIGNAVNACTAETDTGGVTSHSVTVSGLFPGTTYQYFAESRGVANGSPQDYLATVDPGTTNGCCNDTFSTAAVTSSGTTTVFMDPVGPNAVAPGYPLVVGLYYGAGAGETTSYNTVFTITGAPLPPHTQVHWPDQQDAGLTQGTVSTTDTTNDTLTIYGVGTAGTTQFSLLTNVGGTTPAGTYTITITEAACPQSGTCSSPLTSTQETWTVNVATPTFSGTMATVFPTIPDLALWQTNMTFGWPTGTDGVPLTYWYNGENRVGECESYNDSESIHFYDGAWVYDQIGMYTGNTSLWINGSNASPCPSAGGPQGAAAATALYHQYIAALGGNIPGFWIFPHGLYYACTVQSSSQGCTDLHTIANGVHGSIIANYTSYFDATNIRESCYALGMKRFDYDTGTGSTTLAQVQEMANYCLGHIDNIVNGTTGFEQPFMDGLLSQALIEYYLDPNTGNQSDARILPALEALADHMWATEWIPRTGNNGLFLYNMLQQDNGVPVDAEGDMRTLNLLIAPLYAWLYEQTGLTKYLNEGDAIWDSGVNSVPGNGVGWSGKNFSIAYRWSFDYAAWRSH